MKLNKLKSLLVGLGIVSLAGLAQANTVIYLTGSTAARAFVFGALGTAGQVFTNTPVNVNSCVSSSTYMVFRGGITGVGTVDVDCTWNGSEAGIAAVAGATLTQTVNGGTYSLPGVPPAFLDPTSGYATTNLLSAIAGAPSVPDLAMADSSQNVSLTPNSGTTALKSYGTVGIVPFVIMKGYQSVPDATYSNINNITTAAFNQALGGPITADLITGSAADAGDYVLVNGRNKGSGTRVGTLLNGGQYAIAANVQQYAWSTNNTLASLYPSGTPGTLTFCGSYASNQTLVAISNDGFDSGSSVQKTMNVDGANQAGNGSNPFAANIVLIGYMGLSDAANAHNYATSPGGAAVYLPYNGVYESDAAVENGSYTFWGQEHIFGTHGQSATSAAGYTATALKAGIIANLSSTGAGTKTGAVGPTYTAQSPVIPTGSMQVGRGTDAGFPVQGQSPEP